MTKLAILKAMRKGLTPPENFDADELAIGYPHCVIGEMNRYTKLLVVVNEAAIRLSELGLNEEEIAMCRGGREYGLTHRRALAMIDRAIKRMERKKK